MLGGTQFGVLLRLCALKSTVAISSAHTQLHTQALEGLRCRASSKAQCSQCAGHAAFKHQRCATGPSGLPNSLLQHWQMKSEFIERGRRNRGREGLRRGAEGEGGEECEREIKNEGKFIIHCSERARRKEKSWRAGEDSERLVS